MRTKKFNIEVGTGISAIFARMHTKPSQLLCEFIDNSLQSFLDNRPTLKEQCGVTSCKVNIVWTDNEIILTDNAYGMDEADFNRALRLNAPAPFYSSNSLSKYGIGLKSAAVGFGDEYSIKTTRYGLTEEYYGKIDVKVLEEQNPKEIECEIHETKPEDHFTEICIKKLRQKYTYAKEKQILRELGCVYEDYLNDKSLSISLNRNKIEYSEPTFKENPLTGQPYYELLTNVQFKLRDGKTYKYSGFIAILKEGSTYNAGLTLKKNKRGIVLSYRPRKIFGAPTTFKYQRIYGEINFEGEDWIISVEKDGIIWGGTELEDAFLDSLSNNPDVQRLLRTAATLTKKSNPTPHLNTTPNNANIYGLPEHPKYNETITINVNPYPGWTINQVKLNKTVLSATAIDKPNTYSFKLETIDNQLTIITKPISDNENAEKNVTPLAVHNIPGTTAIRGEPGDQEKTKIISGSMNGSSEENTEINYKPLLEEYFQHLSDVSFPEEEQNAESSNIDEGGVVINFRNKKFSFLISDGEESSYGNDFFSMTVMPHSKNTYLLNINPKTKIYKTCKSKETIYVFAIALALSRIWAEQSGVTKNDTIKFLATLNDVMACIGE